MNIRRAIAQGDYDEEYAEYIMNNAGGDRVICNGHMLTEAMEDGYLYDDFVAYCERMEDE